MRKKEHYKLQATILTALVMMMFVIGLTHQYNSREQFKVYAAMETSTILNGLKLDDKRQGYYQTMNALPYIDTEQPETLYVNNENIESFLKANFPSSPLIGKTYMFYEQGYKRGFNDEQIKLLIAISGTESGFGTKAKYHNYWGIMCKKDGEYTTDCGWQDDFYAIGRACDRVGCYLRRWDGGNTEQVFIGSGKYCTSGCNTWVSSTDWFLGQF